MTAEGTVGAPTCYLRIATVNPDQTHASRSCIEACPFTKFASATISLERNYYLSLLSFQGLVRQSVLPFGDPVQHKPGPKIIFPAAGTELRMPDET
jgi:hypothetical protein